MSLYEYDEEKQLEMERSEAEAIGEVRGIALTKSIFKLSLAGKSAEEIAKECKITAERVKEILE